MKQFQSQKLTHRMKDDSTFFNYSITVGKQQYDRNLSRVFVVVSWDPCSYPGRSNQRPSTVALALSLITTTSYQPNT